MASTEQFLRYWSADQYAGAPMDVERLRAMFVTDDGLLPSITFDFSGARAAADAYAAIQRRASGLEAGACYWSRPRRRICAIELGENPAEKVVNGEAEAFRVVFTGLRSADGAALPDIGVFILSGDFIALDYCMGTDWSERAIAGLLDLMSEIAALSPHTIVSHEGNQQDPDGEILLSSLNEWRAAHRQQARDPRA